MTTRFTLVLLVVLALVAGAALGPWVTARPGPGQNPARSAAPCDSVAVLPFDAPKDLHDGVKYILADWVKEIPVALLNDTTIRVARPESVRTTIPTLRGAGPLAAGNALGTATVLTGMVRVEDDGAKLLIDAELLDTENGLLMWAKTWEVDDILKKIKALAEVRDEIIAGVKARLEREAARQQPRK
jgi:TolB-like protein